jgi:multisubunit Na+/H+ antiporter MnhE subunit
MKSNKVLVFITGAVVLAFVYIVLSESYSLKSLAFGSLLGAGSMFVCILFFPKSFLERYNVRMFPLVWYIIRLIFIIIISGFKSLILGYSKNSVSLLIEYESELESDMLITLLANSITLTPGTTTIDKSDKTLRVMRLCKKGDEANFSDITRMEKMIMKAQRSAQ